LSESASLAAIFRPVSLAMAILLLATTAPADTNVAISGQRTASAVSLNFAATPKPESADLALAAASTSQPTATAEPKANVATPPGPITGPSSTSVTGPVSMVAGAQTLAAQTGTWTFNLYDPRAERWQDPDLTACTAASLQSMLNTVAFTGSDPTLLWQPNNSYAKQESILAYERAHMTMRKSSAGSDPHGWRNALNYYGWGSIDAGVYRDSAYSNLGQAAVAVVLAIAKYHKPVGVFSQGGAHSEFITGYRVVGDDPSTGSASFRIVGVYLTDPWRVARYRNAFIPYSRWRWGFNWLRYTPYWQSDSPYRDPIDGHIGKAEWYGKWITIEPVK
jgi:hypothetical protein